MSGRNGRTTVAGWVVMGNGMQHMAAYAQDADQPVRHIAKHRDDMNILIWNPSQETRDGCDHNTWENRE